MMLLAHIGGVPVEEMLMPLLSSGISVGVIVSVMARMRRR